MWPPDQNEFDTPVVDRLMSYHRSSIPYMAALLRLFLLTPVFFEGEAVTPIISRERSLQLFVSNLL